MTIYEVLMFALGTLGAVAGLIKWTLLHTDAKLKEALEPLQGNLNAIKANLDIQWSKVDTLKERLLILETRAVNESDVRRLNDEHRASLKQDLNEVKAILQVVSEAVESLKVSVAVSDALARKEVK